MSQVLMYPLLEMMIHLILSVNFGEDLIERQILELSHFMRLDLLMMEWGKNYTGINFILLLIKEKYCTRVILIIISELRRVLGTYRKM